MEIGIGRWSAGQATERREVRNYAGLLRLHGELERHDWVNGPRVTSWQRTHADREPGKEFSWGSINSWGQTVYTTLPVMERAALIARRYTSIREAVRLAKRLQSPNLTVCGACGGKTVEFSQDAWADRWICLNKACDYEHEYRLGD